MREAALIGAVLAGSAFLLAQAAILAAETPGGLAALPALAWARLAIPTLSAAAAGAPSAPPPRSHGICASRHRKSGRLPTGARSSS
ncbi:hypothetical protein ACFQWF_10025 [Methylorubrum suomiense]